MSVTTDISDDDAAFMPSDMPVDDPFGASAGEKRKIIIKYLQTKKTFHETIRVDLFLI